MVLQVPTVNPRLANITAPQLPKINVLGALQQGFGRGDIDRQNKQAEQLQGVLQAQGPAALGGDIAALQEIALQGEDGAELAANLQKIVMSQNDQEFKVAQRELNKQGTFLASLINADPDVQRRKIFDRANDLLSEGDRKNGAEFLRISQLKDPLEIKGELQSALTLVAGGDKFLQSFVTRSEGRVKVVNKINEETRSRVGKQLTTIKDTVTSIESNARKIKGLTKQIEKGNRGSVAQTLISMVKLGEPNSAVLVAEMEAALNNPALMAGALKSLEENATSPALKALVSKIDPLNPENISVNDITSTSNAIVQGQTQSIFDNFKDAQAQAIDLTEEGSRSLFAGNISERISDLKGLFDTGDEDQVAQGSAADLSDEELLKLLRNDP